MRTFDPAVDLFMQLAKDTWDRLAAARDLNMSYGEESITDFCLLEMKRAQLRSVLVQKIDKKQEARWGADWEWWIGNARCGWIRYAVQAKKIDARTGRYPKLRHKIRDGQMPEFQIDRLKKFAQSTQSIPLYCFYNTKWTNAIDRVICNALDGFMFHYLCYRPRCEPNPNILVKLLGCTVVAWNIVEEQHKSGRRKDFCSIHFPALLYQLAMPWHCLLRHHCKWSKPERSPSHHPLAYGFDVNSFKEVPAGIRAFVAGESREVPNDYYSREIGLPRRIAIIEASSEETEV